MTTAVNPGEAGRFVVRRAGADEVPEVGRLTVRTYVAEGFVAAEDDYAATLADATSRFHDAELLVAVDPDGSILGTVTIAPPGSPLVNVAEPAELEFRMLAVASSARGRGVGEALVLAVIDRAAELGLGAVMLSSQQGMTAAHRLYRRFGFQRTPERDWSPNGHEVLLTFRLDR
ncbi:GNAT family N-acetyltransferase [Actinophytocola sediminis]